MLVPRSAALSYPSYKGVNKGFLPRFFFIFQLWQAKDRGTHILAVPAARNRRSTASSTAAENILKHLIYDVTRP